MAKILERDNMKLMLEENGYRYYLFIPTLFHLYPKSGEMHKMNFMQIFRFLLMKIHGYRIYILADHLDTVMGSVTYAHGGSYRFPFAGKKDLIDGPSYTVPEFRGQGVAVKLADKVMNQFEHNYDLIYCIVQNDNISSIKRVTKNGFEIQGYLSANEITKSFRENDSGDHILFVYRRKDT